MPPLDILLSSLFSAIMGGALVAFVSHQLTRRREELKRRVDMALSYRIEAWRKIERQTGREIEAIEFESALADVILLGTENEITAVSDIMDEFTAASTASTSRLLSELRRNIRKELKLPSTKLEYRFLRISAPKSPVTLEDTRQTQNP